jgi:hypothetical protein
MNDIIFWYTGVIAWMVISVIILISSLAGVVYAYNASKSWQRIIDLFGATVDQREAVNAALRSLRHLEDDDHYNAIIHAAKFYHKHLAVVETHAIPCWDDYECGDICLYDGDDCEIISRSNWSLGHRYTLKRSTDGAKILNVFAADIRESK